MAASALTVHWCERGIWVRVFYKAVYLEASLELTDCPNTRHDPIAAHARQIPHQATLRGEEGHEGARCACHT